MKTKHSSVVHFWCLLTVFRVNWARNLQAGAPTSNVTKHMVDMKPTTRQDIYNLDLVNRNGSSALMYSEPNEAINGGFTDWSDWSECSSECGKRTLRSRERYCTNPPPSNGGADCVGERFQLTLCKVVSCYPAKTSSPKPRHVIGKFGQWSGWSKCPCDVGYQKRYRQCNSRHESSCHGLRVERRTCKPRGCRTPVPEEKSSLVDIDPKQFCGFNPCDISKCLLAPLGSCVSDYKCRPVFFDENNKRIESCVGQHLYISPAQVAQVCKINPCQYTRCLMDFTEERCVVGTQCQAVYYSAQGQPQKCTAVLKIPARQVCGYDPCNGESCQDNPNARCLVTTRCRPVFVNSFNERIRKCEEETTSRSSRLDEAKDEEFEAEPDDDNDDDQAEEDNTDNHSIDSNDDDDDDSDDDDGIDSDNDDDRYDNNRYSYRKHFHDEQSERRQYSNEDDVNVDDIEQSELAGRHGDDDEDDDRINFENMLAKAKSRAPHRSKHHKDQNRPNANMMENSRNFSNPLFKLLNVENGERRSKKPGDGPSVINPSSFNLEDLVSGKLDNSSGLIVGTVKKSMKILSNKKPTTYYYFETKGKNPKENRQFMVITAPKTKKSAVYPKRNSKGDK